ncbi:MAG TPA: ribonuclease P protein subunit [Candidatus Thermoplasmatota archaeon]
MPRTRENLARHEWIGLPARVERADDPTLVGAAGRVVDETLRTVTLERPNGREARVAKAGTRLLLSLPGGAEVPLELGDLVFRPQDRVKRARPQRARRPAGSA